MVAGLVAEHQDVVDFVVVLLDRLDLLVLQAHLVHQDQLV